MFSEVLLTFAVLIAVIHTRETPKNDRENEKLFLQVRPEPNPYPFITRMATERLNLTCRMFNRTDSFPVNAYNLTWRVPRDSMNSSGIVPYKFNDGTIGLKFLDLRESDSGDYTCQANSIGLRFTVKLNIKPHINKGTNGMSYCGSRMFICSKSILVSNDSLGSNQIKNNQTLNDFHSPCISDAFVCDGKSDCPNQEDESSDLCGQDACTGKLRCSDNRCIPRHWCEAKIPHDCCRNKNNADHMTHDEMILSDSKSTMHNTIVKSNGDFDKRFRFVNDYGEHVFEGSYLRTRDSKSGVDFLHITIYTIIACAIALTIIVLVLVTMLCKTYISNRQHFEQENCQSNNYRYSTYQDMNRFRQPMYRNGNYQYPAVDNHRMFSAPRSAENEQIRENCSIRNLITRWLGIIRGNEAEQDDDEMSRRMNLMNEGTTVNSRYTAPLNHPSSFNYRTNTRQINPTRYSVVSQYDETLPTSSDFRCPRRRDIYHVDNICTENDTETRNIHSVTTQTNNADENVIINSPSNLWTRICNAMRVQSARDNTNQNVDDLETTGGETFEDVNLNELNDANVPAYSAVGNANNSIFGQGLWAPVLTNDDNNENCNACDNLDEPVPLRTTLWTRICNIIGFGSSRINTSNDPNLNTPIHSDDVFEQGDLNLNFNEILSSDEDFLTRLEDISRNVVMVSPPPYTELMLNEPPVGPPPPYASRDNLADFTPGPNNSLINKFAEQNQENLSVANEGFVMGNNNLDNDNLNEQVMPSTSTSPETTDRNSHNNGMKIKDGVSSNNNVSRNVDVNLNCNSSKLLSIVTSEDFHVNNEEYKKLTDLPNCNVITCDKDVNISGHLINITDNESSSIVDNLNVSKDSLGETSLNANTKLGSNNSIDFKDISNNLDQSSELCVNRNVLTDSQIDFNKGNTFSFKKNTLSRDCSESCLKNINSAESNKNLRDLFTKNPAKYKFFCGSLDIDNCDTSNNGNDTDLKFVETNKLVGNSDVPNDQLLDAASSSNKGHYNDKIDTNTYFCDRSNMNNNMNICDTHYDKIKKSSEENFIKPIASHDYNNSDMIRGSNSKENDKHLTDNNTKSKDNNYSYKMLDHAVSDNAFSMNSWPGIGTHLFCDNSKIDISHINQNSNNSILNNTNVKVNSEKLFSKSFPILAVDKFDTDVVVDNTSLDDVNTNMNSDEKLDIHNSNIYSTLEDQSHVNLGEEFNENYSVDNVSSNDSSNIRSTLNTKEIEQSSLVNSETNGNNNVLSHNNITIENLDALNISTINDTDNNVQTSKTANNVEDLSL